MARGELVKKLLASYGHEEEFRAVVEQIISEEEKKNNRVLASSLRKTLDNIGTAARSATGLSRLVPFPDEANDFIQRMVPAHGPQDILLSPENTELFLGLIREFRQADRIRRHGFPVRSKLLFCGPPGTGKTLCAEVFANELGLPFFHVRLDSLISSYLGETATNIRKTFEFARRQPCVLFFDEFDAIARSREEAGEHSELRRVVNSLLIFIEQIQPGGFLIAATNLDGHLDPAVWRRFDEIVWFDAPDAAMVRKYLVHAFRNVRASFDPAGYADQLLGYSYADLERVCVQAMKVSVLGGNKAVSDKDFREAMRDARRRLTRKQKLEAQTGE
ncbi:ATPase family associated with various cellular activities (AAA) [Paracoccus halophilus]|uniref:ATPase AAA n=1 Tax=Paracoccus halophilus TaxID=376733 RepID=A0A099ETX4_9RHOB|nr:AAA family ATPase [Paracoccus halophilus]KGJ01724.1 ATPase AAA [Paracoccus halophilus]SFA62695.1 ATPase family associated with various cellular activities (AAA) [Paracoccus halophilus]